MSNEMTNLETLEVVDHSLDGGVGTFFFKCGCEYYTNFKRLKEMNIPGCGYHNLNDLILYIDTPKEIPKKIEMIEIVINEKLLGQKQDTPDFSEITLRGRVYKARSVPNVNLYLVCLLCNSKDIRKYAITTYIDKVCIQIKCIECNEDSNYSLLAKN